MLLMEIPPQQVLDDDDPLSLKARHLFCEHVVYTTMRQVLCVGKKEVNYRLFGQKNSMKKRELATEKGRARILRAYYNELKQVIHGATFAKLCEGMRWPYKQAKALLLANLDGRRLDETEAILKKVGYHGVIKINAKTTQAKSRRDHH